MSRLSFRLESFTTCLYVIAPKAEWCAAVTSSLALWLVSPRLKADSNTSDIYIFVIVARLLPEGTASALTVQLLDRL